MFVNYTTPSRQPGRIERMKRVLICSSIGLWMLAVSGAVATSSAMTLNPVHGAIRLSKPLSEEGRLHDLQIEQGKSISILTDYTVKRISVGDSAILDVVALGAAEIYGTELALRD